jgi:23S rRNA pseudouridine2605 synthase
MRHMERIGQEQGADNKSRSNRIAKVIARSGLCSRRQAEVWISEGRVSINGKNITSPAVNVTNKDNISVDGNLLPAPGPPRLWRYHKPSGLVTTNRDPENRPTIFERLPKDLPRVLTIGRLDITTEGLLLLTNDGDLARALELPKTGWLRRYRVRVHGRVDEAALAKLKNGVVIDGIAYREIDARLERTQGANAWLIMSLREGKNREIKNVLTAINLRVNRLIRTHFGPFTLGKLERGAVEEVPSKVLRDQLPANFQESLKPQRLFDAYHSR